MFLLLYLLCFAMCEVMTYGRMDMCILLSIVIVVVFVVHCYVADYDRMC